MDREQQLRYLEKIYGDIEEGKCTLVSFSTHNQVDGSRYLQLELLQTQESLLNSPPLVSMPAPSHNHGSSGKWYYEMPFDDKI